MRRRHLHVPLENLPVESIARAAANEVRPHGPNQLLERPDSGPLSDGVAQRRLLGRQMGNEDVVHVAAMVHDEDHGGAGRDRGQPLGIHRAETHTKQRPGELAGQPVADPEIDECIEVGDDLACIGLELGRNQLSREIAPLGMRARGLCHLGIEDQAVDQHPPAGQLERSHMDLEPRIEVGEGLLRPAPQQPADARREQAHDHRPGREQHQHRQRPNRDLYRVQQCPQTLTCIRLWWQNVAQGRAIAHARLAI